MAKKIPVPVRFLADPATTTLAEASTWVKERIRRGAVCPCCDQLAKIYKRKLNSSMAYALLLIRLAFRTQTDWLHVPEYLTKVVRTKAKATTRGGDWAKLVHWKLIVPKDDEIRGDGSKRAGFYKITDLGIAFVDGRAKVPKHVFLYAQKCLGVSEEMTTIDEALGDKFNYSDLMSA
jgi:hypothetical protein